MRWVGAALLMLSSLIGGWRQRQKVFTRARLLKKLSEMHGQEQGQQTVNGLREDTQGLAVLTWEEQTLARDLWLAIRQQRKAEIERLSERFATLAAQAKERAPQEANLQMAFWIGAGLLIVIWLI